MEHSKDHLSGAADVGRRGGCTMVFVRLGMLSVLGIVSVLLIAATRIQGADLPSLPRHYNMGDISRFGTYSDAYYAKRWKELCKGGGRYQAMAEAYDRGQPDPCNGAKERLR